MSDHTSPAAIIELVRSRIDEEFDGEAHLTSSEANQIVALLQKLIDVQEAIDAAELESGLGNGNLWRFWCDKANNLAKKNAALKAVIKAGQ